jgi:hypothetical protein
MTYIRIIVLVTIFIFCHSALALNEKAVPEPSSILAMLDKVAKPDGSIDESFVVIEKIDDMLVFDADHPRPANAISADTVKLSWN